MSNLFNKGNTFYFIASSLATLTLLTSLVLINVPSSLILALAALSALALMLLYKIMSNNRRIEDKFTQKERELEEKITLAAKKIEKLNDQLTREKQNLDGEVNKVNGLECERDSLKQELESKKCRIYGMAEKLDEITKEKDKLGEQGKKFSSEILHLHEQLQEKEANLAEKEECITELKRKIDNNKHTESENAELYKKVEKLSKEKEELLEKIREISENRKILSGEIEELHREKDTLNNELSEKQDKIKKLEKENRYLSEELEKKSEELNQANGFIEDQFLESKKITKKHDNKVRDLENLLLKRDDQIEQLQCMKVEESIRENEAIKDYSEKRIMQFTPGKYYGCESQSEATSDSLQKDLGYESSPASTPTKLPNSLLTGSYELSQFNQSEGICKT